MDERDRRSPWFTSSGHPEEVVELSRTIHWKTIMALLVGFLVLIFWMRPDQEQSSPDGSSARSTSSTSRVPDYFNHGKEEASRAQNMKSEKDPKGFDYLGSAAIGDVFQFHLDPGHRTRWVRIEPDMCLDIEALDGSYLWVAGEDRQSRYLYITDTDEIFHMFTFVAPSGASASPRYKAIQCTDDTEGRRSRVEHYPLDGPVRYRTYDPITGDYK